MGGLFGDEIENINKSDEVIDFSEAEQEKEIEITPRSNPDLFGHDKTEKLLLNDYKLGRLPHSIILAGAVGIGKATLAFRLARFLFSQSIDDSSAALFEDEDKTEIDNFYVSPNNPIFKRVVSAGHADLLVIEREFDSKRGRLKNEISVESVRKIHPFMHKTAAEGGWRVVIIDGAEGLNRSSQNALLKILEEPPKNAIIILTTSQAGAFLPTIRSRCRLLNMPALGANIVSELLDRIMPELGDGEKDILISIAEGSIGKAIKFYEEDGISLYRQLIDIISTIPNLDMVKLHELSDKIGRYGSEANYYTAMNIISGWCERQARAIARGQGVMQSISASDSEIFKKITESYSPDHFLNAWEVITKLIKDVERYNLDKRQAVIGSFLALQNPNYKGIAI